MSSLDDEKVIGFALPSAIKDFVFDLHDATRRYMRADVVAGVYDKFKVHKHIHYFQK